MAILSIEHVSKRFGSFTALDDVSLQVEQGEAVAIIGSSGKKKCGVSAPKQEWCSSILTFSRI